MDLLEVQNTNSWLSIFMRVSQPVTSWIVIWPQCGVHTVATLLYLPIVPIVFPNTSVSYYSICFESWECHSFRMMLKLIQKTKTFNSLLDEGQIHLQKQLKQPAGRQGSFCCEAAESQLHAILHPCQLLFGLSTHQPDPDLQTEF